MERGATAAAAAEMSFINGSLSAKTVGFHSKVREKGPSFCSLLPPSHPDYLSRCTIVEDSSELSIFDAKKYFNELTPTNINKVSPITTMDPVSDRPSAMVSGVSSPSSCDGHRSYRARSFHVATPTASSEASWNSQTGLLSNPPGAISVSVVRDSEKKTRRPAQAISSSSPAARWIFRSSKCPCTGKKSVQVQESKVTADPKVSDPPAPEPAPVEETLETELVWGQSQRSFPANLLLQGQTTQRIMASGRRFPGHHDQDIITTTLPASGFTFPILKSANNGDFPVRSSNTGLIEDPPRDSLEVFKPSSGAGGNGSPASFALRGSPKSRILAAAAGAGATIICDTDDGASDASSDLFEIESFSTQTTNSMTYPVAFHRRDAVGTRRSSDEAITQADWYEPSEASIDWSVTTAEGFDRASVTNMSEVEEREKGGAGGGGGGGVRRRMSTGNGLLGCRSEKAINVEEREKERERGGNGGRKQQNVNVGLGSRPPSGKKPPLARSQSARLSLGYGA